MNAAAVRGATRLSHPILAWNRAPNNTAVWYALLRAGAGVYIVAYSESTGNRLERPCSNPNTALARVMDFARQYG